MQQLVGCLMALAAAPALAGTPAPGRYQATLCVTTSASSPPGCGPAELDIRSAFRVDVRVADLVYRLHLRPAQVDVATMQGRMEIDEFSAEYVWRGDLLTFVDAEKKTRYEVKAGARLRPAR
jgi:hypothetical protein